MGVILRDKPRLMPPLDGSGPPFGPDVPARQQVNVGAGGETAADTVALTLVDM
jgi:hypothetical protein